MLAQSAGCPCWASCPEENHKKLHELICKENREGPHAQLRKAKTWGTSKEFEGAIRLFRFAILIWSNFGEELVWHAFQGGGKIWLFLDHKHPTTKMQCWKWSNVIMIKFIAAICLCERKMFFWRSRLQVNFLVFNLHHGLISFRAKLDCGEHFAGEWRNQPVKNTHWHPNFIKCCPDTAHRIPV